MLTFTAILSSIILALTAACANTDPAVLSHSATITPHNSLIAEIQITLPRQARVSIEYDNPEAGQFRTALSQPGIAHTIPIVRLIPESTYTYTITTQDPNGATTRGPSGQFTTGPLPPRLDARQTWVTGRSTQPLILTDYFAGGDMYYLLWDEAGNIVWYYIPEPVDLPHSHFRPQTIRQKSNGNLLFMIYQCCITEITPLGKIIDRIVTNDEAGIPHHDFMILQDGSILYPSDKHINLDDSANGGNANTPAVADTLNIWNPQTGNIQQVWDSMNFYDISDPAQRVVWEPWDWENGNYRWTHINSVSPGSRGNFILNSRNRQQILSLSPDFQSIEWQLGGPDSDYRFPNPSDQFYGQHSVSELPNGNILLFDNGRNRPASEGGRYSRALELRLDHDNRTAVKVWEYRATPDIYSSYISSAFRLNNGNTLVNFGVGLGTIFDLITFIETDPQGNVIFMVETSQPDAAPDENTSRYRAYSAITAIMGETMLRPPVARPLTGESPDNNRLRLSLDAYDALDSSQPVAKERFDVYLDNNKVIYRKAQCAPEDTADKFFLHLFPANPNDLPENRQEHGFNTQDFYFQERGIIFDQKCLAIASLPTYQIARIRTGQFTAANQQLWQADFPATP